MSEVVNMKKELDSRTLFAVLVGENADKEGIRKMAKLEGYDASAINVEILMNGISMVHGPLLAMLENIVRRSVAHASEKIGFDAFKDQYDAKKREAAIQGEERALNILGGAVKDAAVEHLDKAVLTPIQALMEQLRSLELSSREFADNLYVDSEGKVLMRDLRDKLRKGNLSEDERMELLDKLEALAL
ncbi:MAG: hypothetical protein RSD49_16365 [Hafnia sp.]